MVGEGDILVHRDLTKPLEQFLGTLTIASVLQSKMKLRG